VKYDLKYEDLLEIVDFIIQIENFICKKILFTLLLRPLMSDGVMVTLQILILSFKVRILVGQHKISSAAMQGFFFGIILDKLVQQTYFGFISYGIIELLSIF
jgi:hypothetical protein